MSDNTPAVAFFLGAGASIEADVPDTAGLITKFLKSTNNNSASAFVDQLTQWADKNGRTVDIELVLATLESLAQWEENPVSSVATPKAVPAGFNARDLLIELRDFIKSAVLIDSDKIKYLAPLRGFVTAYPGLRIFSANYDTAIELFCAEYKLRYRDGFDEVWNMDVFNDKNIDLFLYKLHGSVTWYRSDRGRYLKIPVLTRGSNVELITGERAQLLMLYPAQKFDYVEPLFELLLRSKRELGKIGTLVVVGYTFRDEHIRRMFWDIARDNPLFNLVVIDPRAKEIYETRLRYYEDGTTPSSLDGRVVPLPFLFGRVFPHLQQVLLFLLLKSWESAKILQGEEYQGRPTDWMETIQTAAKAGNYEMAERIYQNPESLPRLYYRVAFEIAAYGLFHAAANRDIEAQKKFYGAFRDLLIEFAESFWVVVHPQEPQNLLEMIFKANRSPQSEQARIQEHIQRFKEIADEIKARMKLLDPSMHQVDSPANSVAKMIDDVIALWEVLDVYQVPIDKYIDEPRRKKIRADILSKMLDDLRVNSSSTSGGGRRDELARLMQQAENEVITLEIFAKYNPIFLR